MTTVITGIGAVRPDPSTQPEVTSGHPVHRVAGFDPEALFGRRATRFSHRSTLLTMAACGAALANAGLDISASNQETVGIAVGTALGSISGTVEFGSRSFNQSRPYLVDAASFPNTAMNTAAGAAAIQVGARAANFTVVAGPLAGVSALRQAEMALRVGHAQRIVAGASDEATTAAVWWAQAVRDTGAVGEGSAMFVLERLADVQAAGRLPIARLAATTVRAVDPADPGELAEAVTATLRRGRVEPSDVGLVALRETGVPDVDRSQLIAVRQAVDAPLLWGENEMGDCYSAHSALQLADVIKHLTSAMVPDSPAGRAGLVMTTDPHGAVGLALVDLDWPRAEPAQTEKELGT
ncbi:beta-ketoacyl synthase N-terminal-like domain-containing protein [Streptomyces sp. NPDC006602]|uniref:beta-ketoacyl synthase N-terminal-like domain-containing protein n=1 Tax=Streptomyces sp. NPDC006602 TaxID=3364751 RepID=UPI0036986F8B